MIFRGLACRDNNILVIEVRGLACRDNNILVIEVR
jgi:hypothetical protein